VKVVHLSGTGDAWTFHRLPEAPELDIHPRHVIHVGANLGQEVPDYRAAGIGTITLVEPDPETAMHLRETYPELPVLQIACGTDFGTGRLRRAVDAGVWSTLATSPMPHGMAVTSEVDVDVVPLAECQGDADMAVIDTQGTELDALRSADLSRLALVVIETHDSGDPNAHAGSFPEVCQYMDKQGWAPVLQWLHEEQGSAWFATYADTFFAPRV
jgi:FkbM family methyltransferase